MDKRTETLRAVVPESLYRYAQWAACQQGRTVSTYLMRLVERDMRMNDDYRMAARQQQDVSTVDMMSTLSNARSERYGPRRAA